jgi:DNA-binding Lrp family transcriptional regulator
MTPSATEIALLDQWQRDFPLVERPFAEIGRHMRAGATDVLAALERLHAVGVLSRIGAVVKPHTVGSSLLAAMRVPPARLEQVAEIVTREPLVNHNYERTHGFNLWFVIAGGNAESVHATLDRIAARTGLGVLDLPLICAYHLNLGFSLRGSPTKRQAHAPLRADYRPDPLDRALLREMQEGLPLVERPFRALAKNLGLAEKNVIERLRSLIACGVISRFGCVVRHRPLGYTANAMAVWDIADERVDAIGARFARNAQVTLCYRRPRRLPEWPYNLFCMIHAKTRGDAHAVIDDLNLAGETGLNEQTILFSTRCFKQRGASFFSLDHVEEKWEPVLRKTTSCDKGTAPGENCEKRHPTAAGGLH